MKSVFIGDKEIGENSLFFIAEIGANFQGDIKIAKQMIREAKKAGADAVKFQSWRKETLMVESLWKNKEADIKEFGFKSMESLLDHLSLKPAEIAELKKTADEEGIYFSSTPVTFDDVDLLENLEVPFYKIASCDLDNLPLIEHISKKRKPIVLSTGGGTLKEIAIAVDTILNSGNEQIILLHCISLYPPSDKIVNLNNIPFFKDVFQLPVGFSDHTIGIAIPLASIAKGAVLIEKHFTLDKNLPGWDHRISATPEEFKTIINNSKRIKEALGKTKRIVSSEEVNKLKVMRRSIVTSRDIKQGEILTKDSISFKRPGTGLSPALSYLILGKKAIKDLEKDHIIKPEDVN